MLLWVFEAAYVIPGISGVEVASDFLVRGINLSHVHSDLFPLGERLRLALTNPKCVTQALRNPRWTSLEARDLSAIQLGHFRKDLYGRRAIADESNSFVRVIVGMIPLS